MPEVDELVQIGVDCPATIDHAEQQRISFRYAIRWFDTHLHGTDAWSAALSDEGLEADRAAGVLSAWAND